MTNVTTAIAASTASTITVRGMNLVDEVIGKFSFTALFYFLSVGRMPAESEVAVLDACLVTLMEHGWTPSSIVTRLMADSVPGEMQVALATGLLAMGPIYAGTSEDCAKLLSKIAAPTMSDPNLSFPRMEQLAGEIVSEHRAAKKSVPGFGHPIHKPDDPRAIRLLKLAGESGVSGKYIAALHALSAAVDKSFGKHLTINATGAIAALLLEIGFPADLMRGVAVVSRAAGLVGHIKEEREAHASREIWRLTEAHIPYSAGD